MNQQMIRRLITGLIAGALALPALADDFIVISSGPALGKHFERQMQRADARVLRRIDQAGVARIRAADADFATGMKGLTVLPDLHVQMIPPMPRHALAVDAANPPFSGDDDFFFDLQWGHDAVNAPEAWQAGARGRGVRVAVLDSGFDIDHPDLAPNIHFGLSRDFTGEGLAYALPDTFSHGSHTAGTVAAADNGFGTIGVAPEAELVLVKVLGDAGSGSFVDVIAGIIHAADVDADLINLSLGASIPQGAGVDAAGVAALRTAMNRAVAHAYQSGTTVIVSAGNDARDGDRDGSMVVFPADMPHAISISATAPLNWALDPLATDLDEQASYTNFGRSVIDFSAPGGDIRGRTTPEGNQICSISLTTVPCWVYDLVFSTGNGGWYWSAGTSMAAPHATGVAALIIGEHGGELHPAQVAAELRARADDLGQPGRDKTHGAGRVSSGY